MSNPRISLLFGGGQVSWLRILWARPQVQWRLMEQSGFAAGVLLFLLLGFASGLEGQDCKASLRHTYEKLGKQYQIRSGKVCHLHYTVRVKPVDDAPWVESEIRVYADTEKSYLVSDQIEVYQDDRMTASVIPASRTVVLTDSSPQAAKAARLAAMAPYQDTLLQYATVVDCQQLAEGRERVVLQLNDRGRKLFRLDRMEVVHVPASGELERMHLYYSSHPQVEEMVMEFKTVSNDYRTDALRSSPLKQVLNGNGQLLPRLVGFEIVDTRTSRR